MPPEPAAQPRDEKAIWKAISPLPGKKAKKSGAMCDLGHTRKNLYSLNGFPPLSVFVRRKIAPRLGHGKVETPIDYVEMLKRASVQPRHLDHPARNANA